MDVFNTVLLLTFVVDYFLWDVPYKLLGWSELYAIGKGDLKKKNKLSP